MRAKVASAKFVAFLRHPVVAKHILILLASRTPVPDALAQLVEDEVKGHQSKHCECAGGPNANELVKCYWHCIT